MAAKKSKFSFRELPRKKQNRILIGGAALFLAVVIVALLSAADLLPHLDGSLNVVGGKLLYAGEKDFIVNMQTHNEPKYYKLGSIEIPEGYYDDETVAIKTDKLTTDFALRLVDQEQAPWHDFTGLSVVNQSAQARQEARYEATAILMDSGETVYGEKFTAQSLNKGYELLGCIYGGQAKDEYSGKYHRYCEAYVPTGREGTCIMVCVVASRERKATLPSDEEMMETLRALADCIVLK